MVLLGSDTHDLNNIRQNIRIITVMILFTVLIIIIVILRGQGRRANPRSQEHNLRFTQHKNNCSSLSFLELGLLFGGKRGQPRAQEGRERRRGQAARPERRGENSTTHKKEEVRQHHPKGKRRERQHPKEQTGKSSPAQKKQGGKQQHPKEGGWLGSTFLLGSGLAVFLGVGLPFLKKEGRPQERRKRRRGTITHKKGKQHHPKRASPALLGGGGGVNFLSRNRTLASFVLVS